MIESATGLILRTRPLTETSLIVQWLSPDFGRISTVAKGARRTGSPLQGKLDLFYLADFTFARSRRSELHTLREVGLRETHLSIRGDYHRLQQAAYCAVLVEQSTETETPLAAVYTLMRNVLAHVSTQPIAPQTVFAFELKLLDELGLTPEESESRLSPGTKRIASALQKEDWAAVSRLKLSEAQVKELGQFLNGFLIFHLGRVPKGRAAAIG